MHAASVASLFRICGVELQFDNILCLSLAVVCEGMTTRKLNILLQLPGFAIQTLFLGFCLGHTIHSFSAHYIYMVDPLRMQALAKIEPSP